MKSLVTGDGGNNPNDGCTVTLAVMVATAMRKLTRGLERR